MDPEGWPDILAELQDLANLTELFEMDHSGSSVHGAQESAVYTEGVPSALPLGNTVEPESFSGKRRRPAERASEWATSRWPKRPRGAEKMAEILDIESEAEEEKEEGVLAMAGDSHLPRRNAAAKPAAALASGRSSRHHVQGGKTLRETDVSWTGADVGAFFIPRRRRGGGSATAASSAGLQLTTKDKPESKPEGASSSTTTTPSAGATSGKQAASPVVPGGDLLQQAADRMGNASPSFSAQEAGSSSSSTGKQKLHLGERGLREYASSSASGTPSPAGTSGRGAARLQHPQVAPVSGPSSSAAGALKSSSSVQEKANECTRRASSSSASETPRAGVESVEEVSGPLGAPPSPLPPPLPPPRAAAAAACLKSAKSVQMTGSSSTTGTQGDDTVATAASSVPTAPGSGEKLRRRRMTRKPPVVTTSGTANSLALRLGLSHNDLHAFRKRREERMQHSSTTSAASGAAERARPAPRRQPQEEVRSAAASGGRLPVSRPSPPAEEVRGGSNEEEQNEPSQQSARRRMKRKGPMTRSEEDGRALRQRDHTEQPEASGATTTGLATTTPPPTQSGGTSVLPCGKGSVSGQGPPARRRRMRIKHHDVPMEENDASQGSHSAIGHAHSNSQPASDGTVK